MTSINFKVIGLTWPGLENPRSGFEPTTSDSPISRMGGAHSYSFGHPDWLNGYWFVKKVNVSGSREWRCCPSRMLCHQQHDLISHWVTVAQSHSSPCHIEHQTRFAKSLHWVPRELISPPPVVKRVALPTGTPFFFSRIRSLNKQNVFTPTWIHQFHSTFTI